LKDPEIAKGNSSIKAELKMTGEKSKQFETRYSEQTRGVLEYETGERNDRNRESNADKKIYIKKRKQIWVL